MKRNPLRLAVAVAVLGAAPVALATGAPSSGGPGTGTTSSPGVSQHNDSETGVSIPSDAPVDSRTHQPVQIGTGSTESGSSTAASREGTGAGAPAYTDLTEGSGSNGDSNKSK